MRCRLLPWIITLLLGLTACTGDTEETTRGNPSPSAPPTSAPGPAPTAVSAPPGVSFTEVGRSAGLTETQSDLDHDGEATQGAAAAVADIDADGDLDIFLPRVAKPNGLYLNDGEGVFTDMAEEMGVSGSVDHSGSTAAVFFDIDADDDLDLFAAAAGTSPDQLFVNDGSGRFTEEAAARGLDRPGADRGRHNRQYGTTVADVDLDGDLDLLVLQWRSDIYNAEAISAAAEAEGWADDYFPSTCETASAIAAAGFPKPPGTLPGRSALYLNDGTGNFTDRTTEYRLDLDDVVALTGVFHDMNGDGWPDLAVTGDGCTSRLYLSDGGTAFENVTSDARVGTDTNGMGSVIADIDGDGTPDWLVTSIFFDLAEGDQCEGATFAGCSGNRVYLNDGTASFTEAAEPLGLLDSGWGWGAAVEDFTNDGRLDVAVTNGWRLSEEPGIDGEYMGTFFDDRTRLMVRSGSDPAAPFVDVAATVGIEDTAVGQALIPFDMDADGDLDLLIAQSNDVPVLYRNDADPQRSWLTISLEDPSRPGNRWGDGARIVMHPDTDGAPIVGWVGTGGSYQSQKPPVVHRGFGERTAPLSRVEVFWPDQSTPQVLTDVPLDQHLIVVRPG